MLIENFKRKEQSSSLFLKAYEGFWRKGSIKYLHEHHTLDELPVTGTRST